MAGLRSLQEKRTKGLKFAVSTAYDALFAGIAEESGADAILVGDSVGMVVLGYPSTLQVTLDEMLLFTKAAMRGVKKIPVIADLPFGTYQVSREQAITNGCRMMQESACSAVKLEGGSPVLPQIKGLVDCGVPVVAHLGLLPQSVHQMGGYRVQAKDEESAKFLVEEALRVQDAGAGALVLECVPSEVALAVTQALEIPTIGIGAGPHTSGQVLVLQDYLGLGSVAPPKFVKKYLDGRWAVGAAVRAFVEDVQGGRFPSEDHTTHTELDPETLYPKSSEAASLEEARLRANS